MSSDLFSRRDRARSLPHATGEIDAVAARCPVLDSCFFLPVARFPSRREVRVRVETRNNQAVGMNRADEFRLERLESGAPGP